MKFIIIEDDTTLVESIRAGLMLLWPDAEVAVAELGAEGISLVEEMEPDLVLLDLGLPDMDGLDVVTAVRNASKVPIIIVTGREGEASLIKALDMGADDYVTKPFGPSELLARVDAILRRTSKPKARAIEIPEREIIIDFEARLITVSEKMVALSPVEWRLLETLAANEGKVVTHQEVLDRVWDGSGSKARIKIHASRLRAKLAQKGFPPLVRSVRGIGYAFDAVPARAVKR